MNNVLYQAVAKLIYIYIYMYIYIYIRPLVRPRRRWEDNIKMDLEEVGCGVSTGSSWFRIGTSSGHL